MKSKTKNRLSQEKIRELVRIHFGQDCKTGKITELKGGMFNAIYRIERIKEKDAIILKVGVIPGTTLLTYERDIMPVEVECYRMIREQTTVPVPEVLAYDFSKKHISSNYFFMTELTGVTFSSVMKKMSQENVDLIREDLAKSDIVIQAWYPLGHGDAALLQEPVFAKLGEKYKKSPVQIILRWHIQDGNIVIPGSKNPDHIRDNFDLFDFALTEEEMAEINALDQNKRYYTSTPELLNSYVSMVPPVDEQK